MGKSCYIAVPPDLDLNVKEVAEPMRQNSEDVSDLGLSRLR